jgi:hypothetical protein
MAGQISYTVNNSIQTSSGAPLGASHLLVGSALQTINANLAAAGSGVLQAASWNPPGTATGDLVALFLLSNQPMTVLTNSASTPQDTINLLAGVAFAWDAQCGLVYPFAGAVTALYLTNTNACTFRGLVLTY